MKSLPLVSFIWATFLVWIKLKGVLFFSYCLKLSMGKQCVQGRLKENLWCSIRTVKCTDSSHLMNSSLSMCLQSFASTSMEHWLKHHRWIYFCSSWCSFLKLVCYLKCLSTYLKEYIFSWDSSACKNILQWNLFLDVYNSESIIVWQLKFGRQDGPTQHVRLMEWEWKANKP